MSISKFAGKRLVILINTILLASQAVAFILNPYMKLTYIGYFCVLVMILTSILSGIAGHGRLLRKIEINWFMLIPVVFVGVLLIFTGLVYQSSNRIFLGLSFFPLIPCVSYCLCEHKSRDIFMHSFAYGNIIAFIILFIISFIFAPILNEQYSSIMMNPNGLAFTIIPVVLSIAYLMILRAKSGKILTFSFLGLTFLLSLSVFLIMASRSRTGLLCVSFTIAMMLIIMLTSKSYSVKRRIFQAVLILAIVLLISTNILPAFNYLNRKSMIFQQKYYGKVYYFDMDGRHTFKIPDWKLLDDKHNNMHKGISGEEMLSGWAHRTTIGKHGEDISSGRFSIWKEAVSRLNIKGHADDDYFFYYEDKKIYTNNTHNMVLAIGYTTGILGLFAIVYLIFYYIYFLLKNTVHVLKRDQESYFMLNDIYLLYLLSINFFITSMLSDMYTPVNTMLGTGFWCLFPMMNEKQ